MRIHQYRHKKKQNKASLKYIDAIESNDFDIISSAPTRVENNSEACLDLFIPDNLINSTVSVLTHQNFTDHCPVLVKFSNCSSSSGNETDSIRDTSFFASTRRSSELQLPLFA